MTTRRGRWAAGLALVLAAGCTDSDTESTPDTCAGDECADAASDGGGDADAPLEPICSEGTAWTAGTALFREATADWGLDSLGVVGTRVNVADIDGDGWPDLLVRRGGTALESYGEEGPRRTWLLRNDGQGRFEDVTWESGIVAGRGLLEDEGRPIDVPAFGDVDNDGDLDVYTGISTVDELAIGFQTSELLLNDGAGNFSLAGADNALRRDGVWDAPAGATWVDVDRDGNLDLWLGQHNLTTPAGAIEFQQDRLFRGDGSGGFVDATDAFGLTTTDWIDLADLDEGRAHSRAWSTNACDLNGDGLPELLAASYGRAPNHLWQAQRGADGAITYVNRSVASGYAFDDDQTWQDSQFAQCFCASNRGEEGCADVPAPAIQCQPNWNHGQDRQPFRLGGNSGATVCADLDNDGHIDLFTTEIRHWWAGSGADGSQWLRNTGAADVVFERMAREAVGLEVPHVTGASWDEGHMTATAFDVDNDGWLDVYIGGSDYAGNRGLLYHQSSPGQFELVSIDDAFEHNRSHGVVAVDLDRDGDLDLVVGHSRARCDGTLPNNCYDTPQVRVFENVYGDGGNSVELRLSGGEGSNRAAIGARVEVTAGGVTQTREVGGGWGHYGTQDDMVLHVGLGTACEADVTVRWPDAAATEQSFRVVSGYLFDIEQGSEPVVVRALDGTP